MIIWLSWLCFDIISHRTASLLTLPLTIPPPFTRLLYLDVILRSTEWEAHGCLGFSDEIVFDGESRIPDGSDTVALWEPVLGCCVRARAHHVLIG